MVLAQYKRWRNLVSSAPIFFLFIKMSLDWVIFDSEIKYPFKAVCIVSSQLTQWILLRMQQVRGQLWPWGEYSRSILLASGISAADSWPSCHPWSSDSSWRGLAAWIHPRRSSTWPSACQYCLETRAWSDSSFIFTIYIELPPLCPYPCNLYQSAIRTKI